MKDSREGLGDDVSRKKAASEEPPPPSAFTKGRIVLAFWLLGMCNNYVYVIMLSAAHDVISKVENQENGNGTNVTTTPAPETKRECNNLSTGAILLADIVPTLFVKIVCPFLPFLVNVRVGFAVLTGIAALILVAMADNIFVALLGVCFASFNSGLGELTLLAYSTFFPLIAVAAWSSGTGGAGIMGAFAYAGMTEGGLTPETSLFVSIIFPLVMAFSFWVILSQPEPPSAESSSDVSNTSADSAPLSTSVPDSKISGVIRRFFGELSYIPKLLPFMIPVGLVYYFEYLINSGLFELLVFENTSMPRESQFRWYNAVYQIGVFVSRSSVSWIHFEKVWIMSVLQGLNVILLTCEAIYGFIPNVWILFVIIFWEGLLGGAAYVNTFYTMSQKIPKEKRLFALSIASVADTFGIVSAGFSSFPVHDAICNLPYDPVFRWPK